MASLIEISGNNLARRGAHFGIFQGQKAVAGLFHRFEDAQKLFEHYPGALLNETKEHSPSFLKSRQALLHLQQGFP